MVSPSILVVLSLVPRSLAQPTSPARKLGSATCFGKNPDFDMSCAAFKSESTCESQVACTWGEASKQDCFAKDGDPIIDRQCKKITNATLCSGQVGCTWRSDADNARWLTAITAGVSALAVSAPTIPVSIGLAPPIYVSSAHDHKEIAVAELPVTLSAWVTKYGLPASVTTALQALVATESVDYKSYHVALTGDTGVVDEVAAGGRNWGGVISLAFAHARTTSAITKYYIGAQCVHPPDAGSKYFGCNVGPPFFCNSAADCAHILSPERALVAAEMQAAMQQLQVWNYPKLSAEYVLLKDEVLGPTFVTQDEVLGPAFATERNLVII